MKKDSLPMPATPGFFSGFADPAGRNFVWNATDLSREIRTQLIVYVVTCHSALFEQNRTRDSVVPPSAIERMLDRWEVPDRIEGQSVEWWVS